MAHPVDAAPAKSAKELIALCTKAGATADALPVEERVIRFIRVNGLWWVMEAARRTAQRIEQGVKGASPPITEPWDYIKAVVNGRPARSTYLYLMLNLWETSLRSRVDIEFNVAKGPAWYADPATYLSEGRVSHIAKEQPGLFVFSPTGVPTANVAKYTNARAFLRELYLPALHNILQENWDRRFKARLTRLGGTEVLARQLNKWLRDAYDARKEVAHSAPIDNALFRQSAGSLRSLLELLELDVDKTLNAIEKRDPHREDFDLLTG